MRMQTVALAAMAGVAFSSVSNAETITLRTMDRSSLESITETSSVLGESRIQSFGSSPEPTAALDQSSLVRFSLIASAGGSTMLTLTGPSGASQTMYGAIGGERDALSLELVLPVQSAYAFSIVDMTMNGVSIGNWGEGEVFALGRGLGGGAVLLEGIDFGAGFELEGSLSIEGYEQLMQSRAGQEPILRMAAVSLSDRTHTTPVPLPTSGLLAVAGLTGLGLLRRRR